jgi:hypothetical protein
VGWAQSGTFTFLTGTANYESGKADGAAVKRYELWAGGVEEKERLPGWESSSGPLAMADIDGDGDLDLFVGGRVIPGRYPQAASSRLYRHAGEKFQLDQETSSLFGQVGLVSGAVWSDLDGDGFPELILACEWGPVKIFHNDHGKLTPWDPNVESRWESGKVGKWESEIGSPAHFPTCPLSHLTGWWNGVAAADLDGDGRLDLIIGNWGLNSPYQATATQPVRLYYGDLSGRGVLDLVEAYFAPELKAIVPRRSLSALSQAMPRLAEEFPTHATFSTATTFDMFQRLQVRPKEVQAAALASMVLFNRGDHFDAVPLPVEAQWAPVFAITVADFDGDGQQDVFLSQNFFALRPELSRLDAGRGLLLRGTGGGQLEPVPGQVSGIMLYGEQRGAAAGDFNEDGRMDLVVTQNGAATRLFQNTSGAPGLRVRLLGPPGNPQGIGATVRLHFQKDAGPTYEVHAGSGYWSQDSAVLVIGVPASPSRNSVRWPGGKTVLAELPADSREIAVDQQGLVLKVGR